MALGQVWIRKTIEDDLDPDRIADSGQCFRWESSQADRQPSGGGTCGDAAGESGRWHPGECVAEEPRTWRILAGDRCLYIQRAAESSAAQAAMQPESSADREGAGRGAEFLFSCDEEEFDSFWHPYFDLATSYRGIRARIHEAEDPFLWRAARAQQGIRILRQNPWETLVSFIISQNKNIPAIRRAIEKLCRAAGERRTDVFGREYYSFPSPEAVAALPPEALAACSLGYRSAYVRRAAESVLGGEVDLTELMQRPPEQQLQALMQLHGVGVKVASCMQLFGLHSLDAFPVDVWVRRILEAEYPDGWPMERYAPYNGVMQQYMFAYYRNLKKI